MILNFRMIIPRDQQQPNLTSKIDILRQNWLSNPRRTLVDLRKNNFQSLVCHIDIPETSIRGFKISLKLCADCAWTLCRRCVDVVWTLCRRCVRQRCVKCSLRADVAWMLCGRFVVKRPTSHGMLPVPHQQSIYLLLGVTG